MAQAAMGHPLPASNGSNGSSGSNGHPTNGNGQTEQSHVRATGSDLDELRSAVRHVEHSSDLVYEDDRDWADQAEAVAAMQVDEEADGTTAESSLMALRRRQGTAKRMPVDREEMIRLMLQGLKDVGYHQSAAVLEAESGYVLASPQVEAFEAAILGGRWSEALGLLPELGVPVSPPAASAAPTPASGFLSTPVKAPRLATIVSGDIFSASLARSRSSNGSTPSASDQAKFLIAQQKYLEYLEVRNQKKALHTLRTDLATVAKDSELLHTLSGFMMCLDKEDLYERAQWDGAAGTSRRRLLEHLQTFISPQVMVPQRRLATLLDQARRYQAQTCMYHEDSVPASLYVDHECKSGQFPNITTHILADHKDEVWRLEWSPDGMCLASAGKDKLVVIWQLKSTPREGGGSAWSVSPKAHLKGHLDPVDVLSWSPVGEKLATASDKSVSVFTMNGSDEAVPSSGHQPHTDSISAIQWRPDGTEFLAASMDCKIIFYSPSGSVLRHWTLPSLQINDFVITPDGTRMIAICTSLRRINVGGAKYAHSMSSRIGDPPDPATGAGGGGVGMGVDTGGFGYNAMEHCLVIIRLADREISDWSQDLRTELTSIKLTQDGQRILVSCSPGELQVWSIEPHLRFIRKFGGHVQTRFLIRSSFGAPKDRFILSGSEDGHVYVWQSNNSTPVQVLKGHKDTVNSVAWNPVATRRLFASCSDDGTVRIWQPDSQGFEPIEAVDVEVKVEEDVEAHNGHVDPAEAAEAIEQEEEGMVL